MQDPAQRGEKEVFLSLSEIAEVLQDPLRPLSVADLAYRMTTFDA
jgi:hypothetical protein